MKVLFLHFNINTTVGINSGITILSAVLKQYGHSTDLLLIKNKNWKLLNEEIDRINPNIVAISIIETQVQHLRGFLYEYNGNAKIILGGPYVTMNPEDAIQLTNINAICLGEGEQPLLEWIDHIEHQTIMTSKSGESLIKNIWINTSKQIYRSNVRSLAQINHYPPEDKSLYPLEWIISEKNHQLEASIGRGCVYGCTYCINQSFLNKYGYKSNDYIRMKDSNTVIMEILPYLKRYLISEITFIDDDFLIYDRFYPKQLREFYEIYQKQIHLPFISNVNPLSITKQNIYEYKKAGGDTIRIGIEGSERLRKEILKRGMNNEFIFNQCRMVKEAGVKISTYNMIGLPTETKGDVEELLNLNAQIEPDYMKVMTFYPFHGTPLFNQCADQNIIDYSKHARLENYETESCLKFNSEYLEYLKNVQQHFDQIINRIVTDNIRYIRISRSVIKKQNLLKENNLNLN